MPSTERKVEILEAALQEFSSNGYVNTTVERIGARAGLTKSGVYAHYRSKDEIFEEMLTRLLAPMEGEATWTPQEADSLPEIVDSYLDYVYSRLREPTVLAALRLILAESSRVPPDLMKQWRIRVLEPQWARQQAVVDSCIRSGKMRRSLLSANFLMAASPAVFGAVLQMLFADGCPVSMQTARAIHRQYLLEAFGTDTAGAGHGRQ